MKIRASLATASFLGLMNVRVDAPYSTAYFLIPLPCYNRCKYCPQAFGIREGLSRVIWLEYEFQEIIKRIRERPPRRICIQTPCNPNNLTILEKTIPKFSDVAPVSVSIYPWRMEEIERLKEIGADMIGLGIDAASPQVLRECGRESNIITWEGTFQRIEEARRIFGPWKVTAHLIVGLGESDQEIIKLAENLIEKEVRVSLFPFYPVKGTKYEKRGRVSKERYRAIQVAIGLIYLGARFDRENFFMGKLISFPRFEDVPSWIFSVIGCPGCNRPYYTEDPSDPYNFPKPPKSTNDLIFEAIRYVEGNNR